MRRSACVLPDTCRPRADPTTARMRRVALEQLRTSGAAELRASWQLDSFFDRTFVVSMRSRCLCPPVRPTASTYASQGWVACLHGRTDRRHHMQSVLAQHGTRKVQGRSEHKPKPKPKPTPTSSPNHARSRSSRPSTAQMPRCESRSAGESG
jgi:hypothetical protein